MSEKLSEMRKTNIAECENNRYSTMRKAGGQAGYAPDCKSMVKPLILFTPASEKSTDIVGTYRECRKRLVTGSGADIVALRG